MTLVDSSAWIHFLREDGDAAMKARITELLEQGSAAWCDMVRLELWNGARSDQDRRDLEDLETFVRLLPTNADVWAKARHLAGVSRKRGKTSPSTDLLIAACALENRMELLHDDAHFKTILTLPQS